MIDYILATDKDGYDIFKGDMVTHNRKLYQVTAISRGVSKDNMKRKVNYLELMHYKNLNIKKVEDRDVERLS